jgi:hypothetical protein
MDFKIELERGDDGRWISEVAELPDVLGHGTTKGARFGMTRVNERALRGR